MENSKCIIITGKAVSVRGNDIDTDRIIPARYLRCIVFDGLGKHAFEDDIAQLREKANKGEGKIHPFENPVYSNAEILFVNKNFGCGSSREHAPQAIMRWGRGIKVIVGESFAEIFFGNCVVLGIPCLTVDEITIQNLMNLNENNPDMQYIIDLEMMKIIADKECYPVNLPEGPRKQFLEGRWDSTTELLEAKELISAKTKTLPYFNHWK